MSNKPEESSCLVLSSCALTDSLTTVASPLGGYRADGEFKILRRSASQGLYQTWQILLSSSSYELRSSYGARCRQHQDVASPRDLYSLASQLLSHPGGYPAIDGEIPIMITVPATTFNMTEPEPIAPSTCAPIGVSNGALGAAMSAT